MGAWYSSAWHRLLAVQHPRHNTLPPASARLRCCFAGPCGRKHNEGLIQRRMSRCPLLLRQCCRHAGRWQRRRPWVAASCRAGGRWVNAQPPWMVLRRCVRRRTARQRAGEARETWAGPNSCGGAAPAAPVGAHGCRMNCLATGAACKARKALGMEKCGRAQHLQHFRGVASGHPSCDQ